MKKTAVYQLREFAGASQAGTLYRTLFRDTGDSVTLFHVGDVALFEADGGALPFVGLIERFYESATDGESMLVVRWFYRPKDCPKGFVPPRTRKNELFLSNQRDTNSVTSLIDLVSVCFDEGLMVGPSDPPPKIKGSITSFVCNSEFEADKQRFRALKPKTLMQLRAKVRTRVSSAQPAPEFEDSPEDDAPLSAGGYVPESPASRRVESIDTSFGAVGPDGIYSPRMMHLDPTLPGTPRVEPVRRTSRVGAEYQAVIPVVPNAPPKARVPVEARERLVPIADISTSMRYATWEADEVLQFCVGFNKHGKRFALVAKGVPTKSTKDCVEFYYRNKYRKDRPHLKDSIVLQSLYGPGMPTAAAPLPAPSTSGGGASAVSRPPEAPVPAAVKSTELTSSTIPDGSSTSVVVGGGTTSTEVTTASRPPTPSEAGKYELGKVPVAVPSPPADSAPRLGSTAAVPPPDTAGLKTLEHTPAKHSAFPILVPAGWTVPAGDSDLGGSSSDSEDHRDDSQPEDAADVQTDDGGNASEDVDTRQTTPLPEAGVDDDTAGMFSVDTGDVNPDTDKVELSRDSLAVVVGTVTDTGTGGSKPVDAAGAGTGPNTSFAEVVPAAAADGRVPSPTPASGTGPASGTKRPRKAGDSTWCTKCVVVRQTVLPCMWARCGNTVCRTCFSQQMPLYRARAVGDSWRGACLNPFFICLPCSGVPMKNTSTAAAAAKAKAVTRPPPSAQAGSAMPSRPPARPAVPKAMAPPKPPKPQPQVKKRPLSPPPVFERQMPVSRPRPAIISNASVASYGEESVSTYRDSIAFLGRLKATYIAQPHVHRGVIRLLQLFREGHLAEEELARQVFMLLRDSPQLIREFTTFLSASLMARLSAM